MPDAWMELKELKLMEDRCLNGVLGAGVNGGQMFEWSWRRMELRKFVWSFKRICLKFAQFKYNWIYNLIWCVYRKSAMLENIINELENIKTGQKWIKTEFSSLTVMNSWTLNGLYVWTNRKTEILVFYD